MARQEMPRSAPSHEGWADTSPRRHAVTSETLVGLVERVTFHNPDNGFCVLRVKARGQRDLVTVVGHAPVISAGEFVQATGIWANDRTHGPQFKASFLHAAPPTTVEGIEKYLGSGMIRGIGPVYSRKSSEEGLELAFNSLDAQREACAAYIDSQRHEGWIALDDRYDDGGYSGGTLDRPALQRLSAISRPARSTPWSATRSTGCPARSPTSRSWSTCSSGTASPSSR